MNTNDLLKEKKRHLNKTCSMQFRILTTIIFAMFAITLFIGGISIYEVDQYIQDEAENFVVVTCENEGAQINNIFDDMEKSVKVMESYVMGYVVPMYHEEQFIGIVGMDFDYTVLAERVHEIKIYEKGFAHLEIDGAVIHGGDHLLEEEITHNSNKYLRVSKELTNGMTLVLSANYDDIRQIRYDISFKILFAVLILSAFFTVVAIIVVNKIVAPLKKLADASVKLSNGDYNVEFVNSNVSEIELLNTAFENMAIHLHEREKELRFSANRDSLTGLRNTTSYKRWVAEFDKEIANKTAKFGVVVFDLNQLKETNDTYGHDVGDKLIVTAAKVISNVFKRSPVFRIGGDEFLAALQHKDLEDCEKLFAQLDLECAKTHIEEKGETPISVAWGFARFDSDKDLSFNDVFKRADNAMYENKRKNKEATV